MTPKWPERARLPRGRHTHAVGYASGHADRVTACARNAELGHFLDDDSPVPERGDRWVPGNVARKFIDDG